MLDWIIGGLAGLAAIIGFRKGFIKSVIGLCGNFIALAGSYTTAVPVTIWLDSHFQMTEQIGQIVRNFLPMPEAVLNVGASSLGVAQLKFYLEQTILPEFVKQNILSAVQEQIYAIGTGVYATMADMISKAIAWYLLRGIVFVVFWILCGAVCVFFSRIFVKLLHGIPVIGFFDRVAGMFVALIFVAVTVVVFYQGFGMLGLFENSLVAQSQILQFCGQLLNHETTVV